MIKAKAKIYHSFENLLQKKTIDHISVTEIIQEAHVARNTFYKYFKDKYDLGIKWFQAAFWDRFDFFDDFSGSYRESVKDLYQHRFLYWHLISSPISQNSIYNYMIFSSIQITERSFSKEKLSEKQTMQLRLFIYSCVFCDWDTFLKNNTLDIDHYVDLQLDCMPEFMKRHYGISQ